MLGAVPRQQQINVNILCGWPLTVLTASAVGMVLTVLKTTAVKDGAVDVRGTIAAGRHFADRNGKVGHVQEMYMLDESFGVIRVWCVRLRVWEPLRHMTIRDNGRHMETKERRTWTDSHECEATVNVAATWRQAGKERVDMTDDGKVRNGGRRIWIKFDGKFYVVEVEEGESRKESGRETRRRDGAMRFVFVCVCAKGDVWIGQD